MTNSFVLNRRTHELLKNFANINESITFKAGKTQKTCNIARNFLVDAEFDDPIPVDCSIFNLNRLLGVIDVAKTDKLPTLEFGDNSLKVLHEHGSMTIPYAHAAVLSPPPTIKFVMVEEFVSFDLSQDMWSKVRKTASVISAEALFFTIENGKFTLTLSDKKDKTTWSSFNFPNTVVNTIAPNNIWGVDLNVVQLIPGDYKVSLGNISASTKPEAKGFGILFSPADPKENLLYAATGNVVKK